MKPPSLAGSIPALPTPFKRGAIDEASFAVLCERQIASGSAALVVCGSTGEAAALTSDEQARLIRLAVGVAGGRVPVIAGCGASCTAAATALAETAGRCGADALLCAPTPYVKPSQEGIAAHMLAVAQASGLPIVVYDVPGRVGVRIEDATIAALVAEGIAFALKDATADLGRPPRLRALCGPALIQLSGDDATAAAHRAMGGDGCISVTANVTPALCALLHRSWDRGDVAGFGRARDLLAPLHDALFAETNPVPLKAALALLGLAPAAVRLPLIRASARTQAALAAVLEVVMEAEACSRTEPRYALAS